MSRHSASVAVATGAAMFVILAASLTAKAKAPDSGEGAHTPQGEMISAKDDRASVHLSSGLGMSHAERGAGAPVKDKARP